MPPKTTPPQITLRGVRQNNLKNIDIEIPLNSFTVVCGPSGSGKSSLAFETLFAEGQRRYIESLSSYARQFLNQAPKPLLDSIKNIPPAIALEQKNTIKNSRSTVGTTSEVVEYLRLLFSKIAIPHCPNGHGPVVKDSPTSAATKLIDQWEGKRAYLTIPIPVDKRRFKPTAFIKELAKEGYTRFLAIKKGRGKTITIKPGELTPRSKASEVPKSEFYLVIDRLAIQESDKGRLVDSLTQAFKAYTHFNEDFYGQLRVFTTDHEVMSFSESHSCSQCDFAFPEISPQTFSFNSPVGACEECNGFGNILDIDENKVVPNPNRSLREGAIQPFTMPSASQQQRKMMAHCKKKKVDLDKPWNKLTKKQREALWEGDSGFYGVRGYFEYLETKKYKMHVRVFLSRYKTAFTCPVCEGTRLKPIINQLLVHGESLNRLTNISLRELLEVLQGLPLTQFERDLSKDIYEQLVERLGFLNGIGVHYLTLARQTRTLSGGEFQRLVLAKQLGMGLSQTLYVLDEPTIGLHPRDNDRLITQLKRLNELGNTLVVVEHDQDVIASSDYVIEMGPGSGIRGGEVVFSGAMPDFMNCKDSNTNQYLRGERKDIYSARPVDISEFKYALEIKGCSGRNLKNVSSKIPLNRIVTVTGVSGSGKSTLVTQTLFPALKTELKIEYTRGEPYKKLTGQQYLKNVLHIDQSAVGKSERSNPATYLKIYDVIRDIFASTDLGKERGYTPGTFSLNVDNGRCPECRGLGYQLIDMVFMDDIKMLCPSCKGQKFRKEVLQVRYRNKNIFEVLNMTIDEAMDFFVNYPTIRKPLNVLKKVGLEYLTLGQSTASLSGGESQRIKIARELYKTQQKGTLYILDEPTTGLHFREVRLLMAILHQIVDSGGSVLLIEHNLEVMAQSDYIIDLGPEAGEEGGKITAFGSPLEMAKKKTHTGQYIKEYLNL